MEGCRRLLWWLVTSLAFVSCLGADGPEGICAVPCCTAEPSCAEASRVTCDCDMDTIIFRGDGPASLQELLVVKAKAVIIQGNAFSSLTQLANFSIRNTHSVVIENGGMALQNHSALTLFRMEDIESVQIDSQAVSGFWGEGVNVELVRIAKLHVKNDAFRLDSETLGPRLMLQDINKLALGSRAFSGPVAEMSLNNVLMEVCPGQSFGGEVSNTIFNNVNITDAKPECFTGADTMKAFSIQSSRIEVLHPGAFSGKLQKLSISSSEILTLHEKGVNLTVGELKVTDLFVQILNPSGFSVMANDSIHLEKVRIERLGKNALNSMLIKPTPSGFLPPVNIHQMDITEAEPGSLTFSECADVAVTDLRVRSMSTGLCPTENLTRALCAGPDSGPLSPTQEAVFWQLYEQSLCDQDAHLPFPEVAGRHRCDPERLRSQLAGETTDLEAARAFGEHNLPIRALIRADVIKPSGSGPSHPSTADAGGHDAKNQQHNDGNGSRYPATEVNKMERAETPAGKTEGTAAEEKGAARASRVQLTPDDAPTQVSGEGEAAPHSERDKRQDGGPVVAYSAQLKMEGETHIQEKMEKEIDIEGKTKEDGDLKREMGDERIDVGGNAKQKVEDTGPNKTASSAGGSSTSSSDAGAADLSMSAARHQSRLMLFLALGVVLSLTAVLGVALVAVLVHRRRRRRREAAAKPPPDIVQSSSSSAVEAALMVLANRVLRQGGGEGAEVGGQNQQGSGRATVYSQNVYEPIRPELVQLQPLPQPQLRPLPHQQPLIRFDSYDGNTESFSYQHLLDR
ncbi:uncharacterized protein LOC122366612 [Amphibalanus amphitrite]|uniref:uncharacterized protein LOC122366612 n=1 Tax=Amphibalanus amphitrite TaxID=1232801 RepID=UPI001C91FD74|nr:uncharacterized protein LOC122366612 [Amphibalanus amphitrite]